jgi:hypothetical protein
MEHPERATHDGLPVYRIPEANMERLAPRVQKMNRRAARLSMPPITLTEVGRDIDKWTERVLNRDTGRYENVEHITPLVLVTVAGTLPRVDGWAMAATIQHAEDGNILRTVPGFETSLPVRFRSASTDCEHCRMDRRRNDTYVLQHESGEWKQVGRSCLADFLRFGNAGSLAEYAEMITGLDSELEAFEDESFGGGDCGPSVFPLAELLAQVACIVRLDGWCSRTEARDSFIPKQATVDAALEFFSKRAVEYMESSRIEKYRRADEDRARAQAAIEWAQALPADVANDYLWNLRVVSHREFIGWRETGLGGSLIAAYNRHLEQELKRKYERENTLDEHFGTIGKREVFTLTVIGLREIEGGYGLTTLVRFRDAAGRLATWFCSGSSPDTFSLDATVTVKATVKAHEEYRGQKQTMLTRVAVNNETARAKRPALAGAA